MACVLCGEEKHGEASIRVLVLVCLSPSLSHPSALLPTNNAAICLYVSIIKAQECCYGVVRVAVVKHMYRTLAVRNTFWHVCSIGHG